MAMKFHSLAELFPLIDGEQFDELVRDIKQHGLREPIWLLDEQILDGRNRYRACCESGVAPRFKDYDGDDPVGFVVSLNVRRRHLSESQRALVAGRLATLGKGRPSENGPIGPLKTGDAANALSVSAMSIKRARKVLDQGADELVAACDRGDVKVSDAAKAAELPKEQQQEALRRVKDGDARNLKGALSSMRQEAATAQAKERAAEHKTAGIDVRVADCLDTIASLDDGSVSLLLTDPPYCVTDNDWDKWESPDAYWEFMSEWLSAMRPKMADKFHAFVFCDATMAVRLHDVLDDTGWPVLRQVIWHKPNLAKKRSGSLTFMSAYEPFWHCGNHRLLFPDVWGDERFDVQKFTAPQSTHKQDQAFHPTQKPLALMRRLVTLGSYAGEVVVDPFCGSGTTAVACALENRRCVTSDLSQDYVDIAKGRLASAEGEADAA